MLIVPPKPNCLEKDRPSWCLSGISHVTAEVEGTLGPVCQAAIVRIFCVGAHEVDGQRVRKFAVRLGEEGEVPIQLLRHHEGAGGAFALSLFATVFLTVAILLAGIDLLMLCCIAYVPGIVFFVMARREHGAGSVMKRWEMALAAALLVIAVVSAVMVASGAITI